VGSAVSLVVNLRHAMASTLPLGGEGRVRGFRRLLALTPHTALAAAFSALAAGTPRYFIGHFWGASALGVFGALSYTLMPGTILTGAMSQAAAPQLARACQRGHHHTVRALAGRLASIAIVMGMGGFTLAWARGEEILLLLYGPAYAGQKHLLLWLILAGIAGNLSSIAAYTAAATRAHARLTVPYLALAVVAAGSSAALVPAYGLVGAAWAGLATSLCGLLIPAFAFRGRRKAHA
jgi:O-antigen/teichoic acid export membrane protein